MPDVTLPYPLTPASVDPQILQPSSEFRKEATKALAAILAFIVTYVLLVIAAFGLAFLCAIGGIGLIALKPMGLTIMLGLGMAGLGVMVVFFLFKFLFKRHKVDRSGLVEIKENEHPTLFAFIRTLANETQTPFPKRVYLSPDVNAAVFYDSSFWSMFLPVKKNLLIGLGLVNSVNVSEFKAIIAHEFGHFSQRSMKVGSYVYNMNHIIFNLLYENDGYQQAMERWASFSGYFAFFASLTMRIVNGIQWILQQMYTLLNKVYMGLSRQMEFHADTVAASVSGGNHLVTSLRRLEMTEMTYNNVLAFYQENFKKGLKPDNIYSQHREAMRQFSEYHGIPVVHDLPQVDAGSFSHFNTSRVVVSNQWASHPSTDDREKHLQSLHIETTTQHDSAWLLFNDPEALQHEITGKTFEHVQYESAVKTVDETSFRTQYKESMARYQAPVAYRGYFDNRSISEVNLERLNRQPIADQMTLQELLTDEVLAIPNSLNGLKTDLQTLLSIMKGEVRVKHFEFNGQKTDSGHASVLHEQLERELKETEQSLIDSDENVITWFLQKAKDNREELRKKYTASFQASRDADNDVKLLEAMQQCLMPLYREMPFAEIERSIATLKSQEIAFRTRLEQLSDDVSGSEFLTEEQTNVLKDYLSRDWEYFVAETYIQDSLERLTTCLSLFYHITTERAFKAKADVLNFQLAAFRSAPDSNS